MINYIQYNENQKSTAPSKEFQKILSKNMYKTGKIATLAHLDMTVYIPGFL
jgi:hypothetical protein